MKVHLINPSGLSFGVGVITPRWLYVLAAATPESYGDPVITDETLEPWDSTTVQKGDVVGIGIHTGNALDGYRIGQEARARGAYVVFGGIHATLYPEEAAKLGGAHAVVTGDGDRVWARVLGDDNCYPVTLDDLAQASRRHDKSRLEELTAMRAERFELMEGLASLPKDMVFFTQITMEAAEDPEFLDAMRKAHIRGALIGVEAVTPEGLKDVYKD